MGSATDDFDIIVVGGGTAGLVIANRLSEDPKLQVLILEAGKNKNDDPKIYMPAILTQTWGDPEYDWVYETVAQENLNGRKILHPRGKVLGGSSAINALSVQYPGRATFDAWKEAGNGLWAFEHIEPYYKKFQTFHAPSQETAAVLGTENYYNRDNYGNSGPIQTTIVNYLTPFHSVWRDTWHNLGPAQKSDPIKGNVVGYYSGSSFVDPRTARRSHAGNAYWEPMASRSNVQLQLDALVEKVIFSKDAESQVTATGVQYTVNGERRIANASKQVILCAGALNTPAILEMSGIGNPKLLEPLGIEVVIDNPHVGENLQDHLNCFMPYEVTDPKYSMDSLPRDQARMAAAQEEYSTSNSGPLASAFNMMAMLPLAGTFTPAGQAELNELFSKHLSEVYIASLTPAQRRQVAYLRQVHLDQKDSTCFYSFCPLDVFQSLSSKGYDCVTIAATQVHPFSRGSTHIASTDPNVKPKIDPKYFSHPLDIEVFARHVLWVTDFISTSPMKDIVKPGGARNPTNLPFQTLDEAKEYAKDNVFTQYHPSCTCAMASKELDGVVDERCKVYGTTNLRIVDASIFPIIPKAPFTSTVYAVAERAADLLKEDLGIAAN